MAELFLQLNSVLGARKVEPSIIIYCVTIATIGNINMLKITKKQKAINKKMKHMQTKAYASEQEKKILNKSFAEWKLLIRAQANHACEICKQTGLLHPHHILPKETYKEFKTEVRNGILLCPSHHKFGKMSAHKNPIWFASWLINNKPFQYDWVVNHMENK